MSENEGKGSFKANIPDDLFEAAVKSVEKHHQESQGKQEKSSPKTTTDSIEVETATESANAAADITKTPEYTALYERLLRVSADFDNYRKRMQREKLDNIKYGAEGFLKAFLPVLDNLDRAIAQLTEPRAEADPINQTTSSVLQGIRMIQSQLVQMLKEQGVVLVDPQGQPFDPLQHEAVETKHDQTLPPGSVLEVHQKGYKLWDRLIRPALVTVSIAVAKDEPVQ